MYSQRQNPRRRFLSTWMTGAVAGLALLAAVDRALANQGWGDITDESTTTGDWSNPAVWTGGIGVPDGTGDVSVTSGTTVTVSGTAPAKSVVVAAGGTLVVSGTGNLTSGTGLNPGTSSPNDPGSYGIAILGTLEIQAGGTVQVTAGAPLLGVGGGTLQLDAGSSLAVPLQLSSTATAGTPFAIEVANGTATVSTAIADANSSFPGNLVKQGSGTLVLQGNSTYTGATEVAAGTLEMDGVLNSSSVTVDAGATLSGFGTIQHDTFVNGSLIPGTATAANVMAFNGNLTLGPASTTTMRLLGGGNNAEVVVGGTLTLGGTLDVVFQSAPHAGDSFLLFSTANPIQGSFATVENSLGNALKFTFDSSTFTVTAVQSTFTAFAQNGNQFAVARALDGAFVDPRADALITALNNLPGASLASALALISPIQQTQVSQTSLNVSRASFGTLQNRLSDVRNGSTGLSLSQFNLMDQNIPTSSLIAGTELPSNIKAFQPTLNNPWGFFAAANGNFGDIDGATSQSNFYGAGFTTGADYRIDPAFAVGFAVGYDYSKTDFDHSGSNSTANSVRFGPYATWKDKTGDWVDGTVGGAYHWYDSNREAFMGTATSSTTGLEFNTSVKYGHDFKAGQWTLTPTFGFDYLHLAIDKYTETGSLAPLAIQDQNADSFRSNTGGQIAYSFQWKGIGWNPYVQAGWAHEFLDASQAVSARFASGAGDVFSTTGDNLGRDSATFGAGLQARLLEDLTVNLSYSGEANGEYQDHSFNAAVRVEF